MTVSNVNNDGLNNINTKLVEIKTTVGTIWSGMAASSFEVSFAEAISAINDVYSEIGIFNQALVLLEKYKANKTLISNYNTSIENEKANPSLKSSESYLENGVTKYRTIYVLNQALINNYLDKISVLEEENLELKEKMSALLESIVPLNLQPKNNHDIAHRGSKFEDGKGNWKILDNSLQAFINAGENGFWGAEADVIQDSSGNLVCSHNAVKKGENPISFEQYLDVCKEYGMTAIIDMKYSNGWSKTGEDAYVNQILETIESKGMMNSCVIQTNNHHDIINVRNNSEDARIWYLTDNVSSKNIEFMKEQNVECVNTQNKDNAASRVAILNQNGIDSCVWAVFTQESKDNLIKRGATYIMSDNVLGITPYQEGDEDYNDIVN